MNREQEPHLSPRMRRAVEELKGAVQQHYPEAIFQITRSPEDRRSIHLVTTVDVPDTTEVVDVVLDRVLELQTEQKLPIHVIPVRPRARVLEVLHEQGAKQPRHAAPSLQS